MTVALLALAAALIVWPVRSLTARRLAELSSAGRLLSPTRAPISWPAITPLLAIAVVVATVAAVFGPVVGVAAAATGATVALPLRASRRARQLARRRSDLYRAITVLRLELEAGSGVPAALAAARSQAGSAVGDLDLSAAEGPAAADTTAFAAAAAVVAHAGTSWAQIAAGLGRDVHASMRRHQEVETLLAGARASAVLLALLPILGMVMAAGLGAAPMRFLLETPFGRADLAVGALLQLLGVAWTLRLANGAQR